MVDSPDESSKNNYLEYKSCLDSRNEISNKLSTSKN